MDGKECLKRLLDWIRAGELLDKIKLDPLGVAICVVGALHAILAKFHVHNPPLIGEPDNPLDSIDELSADLAIAMNVPIQGPFDAVLRVLAAKLLDILWEALREWSDQ